MSHFCRICCRSRPNEKFTGKGHRTHVCKDCARMPKEDRKEGFRRMDPNSPSRGMDPLSDPAKS